MAEFEFLLTDSEQSDVLEYIFKTGAKFIPDLWYREPQCRELTNVGEVMQIRNKLSGPIFLLWEDITTSPLKFDRIEKKEGVFYFLSQGEGGPYMDYFPSSIRHTGHPSLIISGDLSYYNKYWVGDTGQAMKAPQSLKDKYKHIIKFIRSISSRVVVEKRVYWVGHEAAEIIRDGATTNVGDLVLSAK